MKKYSMSHDGIKRIIRTVSTVNLSVCMLSTLAGKELNLVLWLNVLMTYSLGEQTAKVLARLRVCAVSPEPLLFAYAINGDH